MSDSGNFPRPIFHPISGSNNKPVKLGLDLGTAYTSGVVERVCQIGDSYEKTELVPFQAYPKNSGESKNVARAEVPSVIRYTNTEKTIGYQAENEEKISLFKGECSMTRKDANVVRYFKLAIDDQVEFQQERENVLQSLPNGIHAEGPLEDYLTEVFRSWTKELRGFGFSSDTKYQMHCVFPAAWKSTTPRFKLSNAISKAAEKAQLIIGTDIHLWSEPVAATAYLLENSDSFRNDFQKGEAVTVLDCGGGTCDAVTFLVRNKEPLELEEIVAAKGSMSGSECIDKLFRGQVERRLAKFKHLIKRPELSISNVMEWFNSTEGKRRFDGLDEENAWYHMSAFYGLPEDKSKDFQENHMIILASHMREVFDPIVCKVGDLLEEQIQMAREVGQTVNYVVLVGGFSGSPYLKQALMKRINERGTRFIFPNAYSPCAFAAGAIYCSELCNHRIISKHECSIGLLQYEVFDSSNEGHKKADTGVQQATGEKLALDLINFFIKKGDEWTPSQKSVRLIREVDVDTTVVEITVDLFSSQSTRDSYPKRYWEEQDDLLPWASLKLSLDISEHKDKFPPLPREVKPNLKSQDPPAHVQNTFIATERAANIGQTRRNPREFKGTTKTSQGIKSTKTGKEKNEVPEKAGKQPKIPRKTNEKCQNSGLSNMATLQDALPSRDVSTPVNEQAETAATEYYRAIPFEVEMNFNRLLALCKLSCPEVPDQESRREMNHGWAHNPGQY